MSEQGTDFNELLWVTQPGVDGKFDEETRAEIAVLRSWYPELAAWGDQAIEGAWSVFSDACGAISWIPTSHGWPERDLFLAYLWGVQTGQIDATLNTGLAEPEASRTMERAPWRHVASTPPISSGGVL